MKTFTAIIVIPVSYLDREMVEAVENSTIKVDFGSGCESGSCGVAKYIIAKEMGLDGDSAHLVNVYPISDFMDLYNNQEVNESESWMGYVTIEVTTTKDKPRELTKEEAEDKMELIYIEMPSGLHIAIDATYIDQVGDYTLTLPTGEKLNTEKLG